MSKNRMTLQSAAVEATMILAEYKGSDIDERLESWEAGTAKTLVYFMRAGKYVKIGITKDIQRRLAQIQSACPLTITIVWAEQANICYEEFLHAYFHEHREHGEWFLYTDRVARFVKDQLSSLHRLQARGKYLDRDKRGLPI